MEQNYAQLADRIERLEKVIPALIESTKPATYPPSSLLVSCENDIKLLTNFVNAVNVVEVEGQVTIIIKQEEDQNLKNADDKNSRKRPRSDDLDDQDEPHQNQAYATTTPNSADQTKTLQV